MKKTFILMAGLFCGLNALTSADVVFEEKNPLVIKTADTPQSITLKFPAIARKENHKVCLSFKAYLSCPKPSGWNNYLGISLNGKSLSNPTADGEPRLLKRGKSFNAIYNRQEVQREWWKDGVLLVYFGPGQGEIDQRIRSSREEGYTYVFDISDLVNHIEIGADDRIESSRANVLVLTSAFTKSLPSAVSEKQPEINMVIEDLKIVLVPSETVEQSRPPQDALTQLAPAPAVASLPSADFELSVTKGGGIVIKVKNEVYYLVSEYSYPRKPVMGFNILSPDRYEGVSAWQPVLISATPNRILLAASSTSYQLERTITVSNGVISMADKLINKSSQDIGIRVNYKIIQPSRIKPGAFFLGGTPDVEHANGIGDNPSLFLRQGCSSLGIIASDDIFRAHLEIFKFGNRLEMTEAHLGLKTGEFYTLESTIYPLPTTDYFAFVNRIRNDLKINYTVDGPFCFGAGPKPAGMKVELNVHGPWFEYFDGIKYSREQYLDAVKRSIAASKQLYGSIKILAKTECNLVTLDKTRIAGGEKFPKCGKNSEGEYGCKLTAEQSAVINATPYRDSVLRLEDGRVLADTFYPADPLLNLLVQVEENNYRYRNMLEQFDFLLDKAGFDGIYIDQFAAGCGGPLSRVDRCSYDRWDGHTIDLNKNGDIARKYYDYAITGNSARAKLIEHLLDRKKVVVLNTQPTSRLTESLPAISFHEMENDNLTTFIRGNDKPPALRYQGKCQLSPSPVVLGLRPERFSRNPADWAKILNRGVITALRHGLLYYYYGVKIGVNGAYGPVNHMFPFTPVQLGEGFLIGQERIITCISGNFSSTKKPRHCLLFDEFGNEKAATCKISRTASGWDTEVRLKDWNEIAVIILE